MRKLSYTGLLIALAVFTGTYWYEEVRERARSDFECLAEDAGFQFEKLNSMAEGFAQRYFNILASPSGERSGHFQEILAQKPDPSISLFLFENDSLFWWSDNTVLPKKQDLHNGLQQIQNGWYSFHISKTGNFTVACLVKIKNQYAFQNRFLENTFHECFNLPPGTKLSLDETENSYPVKDTDGSPEFYLQFNDSAIQETGDTLVVILYILSYLLFIISFFYLIRSYTGSKLSSGLITLSLVIITRTLSVYFNFPYPLYELSLFSPSYYASSFILNSLGDLLITAFILVYLIGIVYRNSGIRTGKVMNHLSRRSVLIILSATLLFTLVYSAFINHLLSGLIINSRISFNINNVFDLDAYSLVGVIIIGILVSSLYLVCDATARLYQRSGINNKTLVLITASTILFFAFHVFIFSGFFLFADYGLLALGTTLFLILYCGFMRHSLYNLNSFTRTLLIILGFSIYAAQTIAVFNRQKEYESRKLLAAKLENEQDQIAEYLFDDVVEKVSHDEVLTSFFRNPFEQLMVNPSNMQTVDKRLLQLYFTGYWSKYDISVKCFNNDGLPINTGGDPSWNLDYFNKKISDEGTPTYSEQLFFTGNNSGKLSYIGKIPVYDPDSSTRRNGTILITLESKTLQDEAGFPELLISDKIPQKRDISSYSYAHYREGKLVNHSGDFNYLLDSKGYSNYVLPDADPGFVNFDNYSHYFYTTGEKGLLIISVRNPGVLEFITLFSYLFSFYAILYLVSFVIWLLFRTGGNVTVNFKNRIQATVMMVVVITMLLIGGSTVYYIFRSYTNNLGFVVNDRLKTMLIAIQDELSTRSFDENIVSDEMNYTFSKLAGTLGIDLNIYSSQGRLVYSTQPKIFDQQLIARTMNRNALFNLTENNQSLYIQYEEIGKLKFLSAYEPVRNNYFKTAGYINLPYFARQDKLKKDISSYLVTLINIYVLLFAFSIFITFIISSRITKPLQIIQERLGKIRLGKRNELIEWDKDDEIGGLVREYNRMVDELAESAELLAKSERESAWREMAKQVAHEIKNPLTPMKLNVQHLQRAWKEQSPNIDQIMQRFSKSLIEQIDTLSNIATEFSNFAKMPKANNEHLDLAEIVKNTVNFFSENESVTFTYYEHPGGNYHVYADKEQLIRVFSNLFKNALQAIPADTDGHIHVELKEDNSMITVSVRDNGIGITEEEKPRLFTPNFTTKTGGMGLGLAMVKNIVELANGKVWFKSEPGTGTTFYVSLPVNAVQPQS